MNAKAETEVIQHLKITELKPDPDQPRKYFDEAALQELAEDIKVNDLIEPIIYYINEKGKNIIYAGERRWRASKLAKLKTVKCLLREAGQPMERLMTQVSENFQREGLNPIEMAAFFEQMITKHKIKTTQIGDTLQKHGFRKFERSHISNIRRLLQLPEWAQQLIQAGKLSAAHGKHLLPALKSEKVTEHMEAFLKKQTPTTKRLQDTIENAYDDLHFSVCQGKLEMDEDYGFQRYKSTKFAWRKECENCETCQIIKTEHSINLYCLNEPCYDKKQQAAITKIEKAEQRKLKTAETKRKNALAKKAEEKGISVEELEAAEKVLNTPLDDSRARARVERTQQYLDEWLRKQIDAHLLEDKATRYQVILWMAAGAPGDAYCCTSAAGSVNLELDKDFTDHGIDITLQQKVDITGLELMTCTAGIDAMRRNNLRKLAHYVGIKLEGHYSIDREYLDIKQKNEVIETTPEAVIQSFDDDDWGKTCKKSAGFIKDRILTRDYLYGVPADLIAMYNETEGQ